MPIFLPVKVGDTLKVAITGFGTKGNPMAKVDNYVLFVEKYKDIIMEIKQPIEVKVIKVFPKYGFVEVIK